MVRTRLSFWLRIQPACLVGLSAVICGCTLTCRPEQNLIIAPELQHRTGFDLGPIGACGEVVAPTAVALEDGTSEDEAVVLALWNNAAFQEVLVELDLARADVTQASQVPNPELWLLSPVGVKQLEYAIEFPLDVLWLRPRRVRVAQEESERVARTLVHAALTLIRDVRVAYADALLAGERLQIARDAETLRTRIAALTEARLKAGDASPVEAATVRIDVQRAKEDVRRLRTEQQIALERLVHLMGIAAARPDVKLVPPATLPEIRVSVDALIEEAVSPSGSPDVQAAERGVAAAQARRRLVACEWFKLNGIVDANGQGKKGFEMGPGLRVTIPIFNQNQGRISRADAEIERAVRQQAAVRETVAWEVRQAHLQLTQAHAELARWQAEIHPAVSDAIGKAERAYKEGDLSLLAVLESSRQLLEAQGREAQLRAEVRRAAAELERRVGRRLTGANPLNPSREPCPP